MNKHTAKNVVILCNDFIRGAEFNNLPPTTRVVYLYLRSKYKGVGHTIKTHSTQDAEKLKMHFHTYRKALKILVDKGFIQKTPSYLSVSAYKLLVICGDEFEGNKDVPYSIFENNLFTDSSFLELSCVQRCVYIYMQAKFTKHLHGIPMSRQDSLILGISTSSYYRSLHGLEEKSFITCIEKGTNMYSRVSIYLIV